MDFSFIGEKKNGKFLDILCTIIGSLKKSYQFVAVKSRLHDRFRRSYAQTTKFLEFCLAWTTVFLDDLLGAIVVGWRCVDLTLSIILSSVIFSLQEEYESY